MKDRHHGISLQISTEEPQAWKIKFEAPTLQLPGGPSYIKTTGASPQAVVVALLEAAANRGEDWELVVRTTLASLFEPWIETLAKEHGVKLRTSPYLEVAGDG